MGETESLGRGTSPAEDKQILGDVRRATPEKKFGGLDGAGLVVNNLTKTWKEQVVFNEICFEQPGGSICGIAGDNGTGKSTLLKILASVLPRDRGEISFQGISIDDKNKWRRMVGYVPQELALDDRLTVRENLIFWCAVRGFSTKERQHIVGVASQDPLISDFLDKPIRKCSGGMARRASMIVGLLGEPQLFLLDEPFAGADDNSRKLMSDRILNLKRLGKTVLLSSHDRPLLRSLCDKMFYMKSDRMVSGD